MAFAPNFDLFSVPSNSIIISSRLIWSKTLFPINASRKTVFTFSQAFNTPFPTKRFLSPSRNSTASCIPVEAPEGTAARPIIFLEVNTSTSTVGFPLESNISLDLTSIIFDIAYILALKNADKDRA
jgi:hypothetical protein